MQTSQHPPRVVVPLHRRREKRTAERYAMALPVRLPGGEPGTTRDLSTTGLSFTTTQPHAVGERVDVTIDYLLDGHNFPLQCEAEVVRCEPAGQGYTVGARLVAPLLDMA